MERLGTHSPSAFLPSGAWSPPPEALCSQRPLHPQLCMWSLTSQAHLHQAPDLTTMHPLGAASQPFHRKTWRLARGGEAGHRQGPHSLRLR